MEALPVTINSHYFLSGGGEMGKFIRAKDWSHTPLGDPEDWPQSLRTMVAVMLDNPFGMYIAWGNEYTQLYNDRYRPILGTTRHPQALGMSTRETFAEIWHTIEPMFNGVMKGKAVGFPDFMLPLNGNGFVEECYFDFSYSPIRKEDGEVGGVLVTVIETTDKKKVEEALKDSEMRFRAMAESTDILVSTCDANSNTNYFNNAWMELTGKPVDTLLDFGWADLIHKDDRQQFVDQYRDACKKRQNWMGEFRISNKAGGYSWLFAKGFTRFHPNGSFAGYISSSVDITDRKKAEERLQESEQELRSVVENAPFPIGVYVGKEMLIKVANQAMLDAWGKGNDVIGKSYKKLLPELKNQEIFKQLDEVLATGVPFHTRNQRVDIEVGGKLKPFYFNYSFTPLYNAAGNVYGVMNTAADVTDLNLAKQKVEQSEWNFRNMILQAPVAMCILLGPQHIVEVANKFMIALWGRPSEDVMNKPVFEGLPDARGQGFESLLTNVFNTGETFKANEQAVVLMRHGKPGTFYQNFVMEPYKNADGKILGVLVISLDVTAQVLARQKIEEVVAGRTKELADANDNLKKSNADLAQFAYIASHDLQEPLRKIGTFSQMLEHNLADLNEQAKKYLDKIKNATGRMSALIKDVLSYSQVSEENKVFNWVDLNQVATDIKNDYELLIEQKQATLSFSGLCTIQAIPLQMEQLFSNLISNSLKYTRATVSPVINVKAAVLASDESEDYPINKSEVYYKIEFSDNGIGIKSEFLERIFNIFQRLHGKNEYAGTGIGLAICKKIVQNHQGFIYADSDGESGSLFTVILPEKQC